MAISRLRQQNIFDNYGRQLSYDNDYGMGGNFMSIPDLGPLEPLDIPSRPTMPGSQQMQPSPEEGENPLLKEYRSWDFDSGAQPQESEFDQHLRELGRLYTPETYATKRFDDLLSQYPQRQEPDWKGKLSAGLAGLGNIRMRQPGGPEVAEKTMYAPHYRDVADWKTKAEPYYQAANLERQSNATERQLATSYLQSEAAGKRVKESERAARERADVEREKITSREKIAEDRITLERMWRNGWKFNFKGATVQAYKEGQTGPNGEPIFQDTGVKTGNVSEADKLIFGAKLQEYLQNDRQQAAEDLKKTAPGRTGTGKEERENRFQTVWDENPHLRKWMIQPTTTNGRWDTNAPPKPGYWSGKMDPEELRQYNEVRTLLGLPTIIDPKATPPTETPKPAAPARPPAPAPSAKSQEGLGPRTVPAPNVYTQKQYPPGFTGPKEPGPGREGYIPKAWEGAFKGQPTEKGKLRGYTSPQQAAPSAPQELTELPHRRNKRTGEEQVSLDGGITWVPYRPSRNK